MLALKMYVDELTARGGLRLPNGEVVRVNFVWTNMANLPLPPGMESLGIPPDGAMWDYSLNKTLNGYPIFLGLSTYKDVPGSFLFPGEWCQKKQQHRSNAWTTM